MSDSISAMGSSLRPQSRTKPLLISISRPEMRLGPSSRHPTSCSACDLLRSSRADHRSRRDPAGAAACARRERDRRRRPRRAGAGACRARLSGGTAGGDLSLHPRARTAHRLATRQPAGGARIPLARCRRSARSGPHHRRGNTANLEVVLALKPDLILDVGSVNPTYVSLADRVQQQTGIPYALLDGRFEGIPLSYRTLGALIGRREQGEGLARNAEDTMKTVTQRVGPIPLDRRPRVYYARGPRGLETGLGGSLNVETIELVAQNVAGGTRGGLANVSIEQVLLWNPDVIITIDQDFAANVLRDPAWAPVAAVRAHRVHLSPKLPFGWVDFPPTANRLIGLWWLAKILYPDLFPEDLRALTHEFYARFYHVTPSDAQIERVLAGRD